MMTILDRYVGGAVASSTAVVMLVLLALYAFITLTGEMGSVGRGTYTVWSATQYTLLTTPGRAYELFPLTALLGALLGLGTLAGNSELTVMRAAGVSLWRIIWSVMKTGLVLVLLALVVGEAVAPPAERYATEMRMERLAQNVSVNTRQGLWARDGDTFINVRRVQPDGRLVGVSLYELDAERRLRRTTTALSAEYRDAQWLLRDVRRTHFSYPGADQAGLATQVERLPSMPWRSLLTPELVQVVSVSPEMLAIWDLHSYVNYLRANELDAGRYELALWTKVAAPIATGVMVLLAVPFVFGSMRAVGVGQRILVGTLLGIGFYLFNQLVGRAGLVWGISPALAATLPTLLMLALAVWLVRRVR
ncbi:LPS export ABC transporter permease LptG [Ectothiorhodospiraceae bacterium 2226]|nr:LPS export ABC transporter permease LptG [Ectothiorhodospiraceae bacterium 2226]